MDMSIEEVVEILKKHRTSKYGVIDLHGMKIDGSIDIGGMKVEGRLWQNHQTVGESIWQSYQIAGENIFQSGQTAPCMELQNTEGMKKTVNGYWVRPSLEERVNELDIDDGLKKEIVEKLREKK